ncbi:MAG: exodeoxyribonuclease III [Hyphomicrobiales bacterium]
MKIATWNINGVKARIDGLTKWLAQSSPDVVCLQEIKSVDEGFPAGPVEDMGYNVAVHGQKGFNGVAILSRLPFDEIVKGLPGDGGDVQARYLEAVFSVGGGVVRVASIYLPNGNPVDSEKFDYKLAWMKRLDAHIRGRLAFEEPAVFCGDYNVIPQPDDAEFPDKWTGDALFQPASRSAFQALLNLGLTDAYRACHPGEREYTFWDYQAGAWQKNNGIRIDHMLLTPQAADRLVSCEIQKFTRSWEKPSDHVPVVIELDETA